MELTENVLQRCKGFTCKDEDITESLAVLYKVNGQQELKRLV